MDILLVDDNKSTRLAIYEKLLEAGHRVTQATDGLNAFNLAQSNQYQLIISDYKMPLMDGLKLAQNLIEMDNSMSMASRILLLTTSAGEEFRNHAQKLNLQWLSKPVDFDAILDFVDNAQGCAAA